MICQLYRMMGVWMLAVLVSACWAVMAVCDVSFVKGKQMDVDCGMGNMQIIVSKTAMRASKMKILNKDGKMDVLKSDPSCGLWVTHKTNGSVIIGTTYEGCYVKHNGTHSVLTLGFPVRHGGKKDLVRKELRCSMELYQDPPSQDQCDAIPPQDKLSCNGTQDSCATMNCCYDPSDPVTPCYFGNAVTARCTLDGFFYIAVSDTVTTPSLDLNSLHLLNGTSAECRPVDRSNSFILFRFPLSSCGTTFEMVADQAVYENELVATQAVQMWNGVSITRDASFRLRVRCSYSVSGFLPLKVDVATLPPPPPVSSEGPLRFEMRLGVDVQYSDYYQEVDYPLVRVLKEPLYAEVRILGSTDPSLVLVLHQCWATPTVNAWTESQWPILVNGCPFDGDNYMAELMPMIQNATVTFPTHYSRFSLKTFVFVATNTLQPLSGEVYIHCSVSACVPNPGDSCTTACSRRKRSSMTFEDNDSIVSSNFPVYFETSLQNQQNDVNEINGVRPSQSETHTNIVMVTMGVLGILLLAVFTWTCHRQQKSKSTPIGKLTSKEQKCVHIRTVSSELVIS